MAGQIHTQLKGMTWNHDRGIAPVEATSAAYSRRHPGVSIDWDSRPLQDFESQPIRELAENYDLMIIDHPHLGEAVQEGLLTDLSAVQHRDQLALINQQSAGRSQQSYQLGDGQWALSVDAATAVACYRPDHINEVPLVWTDIIKLARQKLVIIPLRAPHSLMALFWLARNRAFGVAENPDRLMDNSDLKDVLDQLCELTNLVDNNCFQLDPIAAYELMSTQLDAPAYCPHGYGYISYARENFRPHTLAFTDVADAAGGGVGGTVLGGTGIAVSALSEHQDIATDYAFWIAGEECQSNQWVDSGGQPGNGMAWSNAYCNRICGDFLNNTRATLESAWVRPRYPGYLNFQHAASLCIEVFLQGRQSLQATIDTLQDLYRKSRA